MQSIPRVERRGFAVRVAVCVATFRRPQLLHNLLEALARLSFCKVPRPEIDVIVVDNDDAQSARSSCQLETFPWKLSYVCEPRRGIVHARNRALAHARDADLLAFVDDDEVPSAQWLDELLYAQLQFDADVVSGMVLPDFSAEVPGWARSGGFFHRPTFKTGQTVRLCSTNNALIRARVLNTVTGFDEQFNFTGAEDTHFFLRARNAGFRMVFCREAIVHESISPDRANVRWLLRRGFQAGNSWALSERDLHPELRVAVLRLLKEFIHLAVGAFELTISPLRGRASMVRSLQSLTSSAGAVAGVVGRRFLPYRGSPQPATHTIREKLRQEA